MNTEFKKIKRISKIQKETKVVNFSVSKNENYLANGILTHNCYMKRHKPKGLSIATNIGDILTVINNHAYFESTVSKPNQTHNKFITYDISCNEDFALHYRYYDWKRIFNFFKEHPTAMATLATKTVPNKFIEFNPERKVRIRFSLMPENIRQILEPNTATIIDRIEAIDRFIEAGYDIHVNFSPVIVYKGWLKDYRNLFELLDNNVKNKDIVKAEVIFLTHNENKHLQNVKDNTLGEELLWNPKIQEDKTSQYGGKNVRYKRDKKARWIREFKELHSSVIPWNTIRYIF